MFHQQAASRQLPGKTVVRTSFVVNGWLREVQVEDEALVGGAIAAAAGAEGVLEPAASTRKSGL